MSIQTHSSEDERINNTAENTEDMSLSEFERDALGEIGNICMGTSATTLSTMLGRRVTITTPTVTVSRGNEYLEDYEKPVVLAEVFYTQGLNGGNKFLLKKDDALLITNLLMGNEPHQPLGEGMEDIYLSAISEVMNQMVGSSATSLANALQVHVNISPPKINELTEEDKAVKRSSEEISVVISFKMEIEDLLVSNIMQIMPIGFAKKLSSSLFAGEAMAEEQAPPKKAGKDMNMETTVQAAKPKQNNDKVKKNVDLKEVQFQSFDNIGAFDGIAGNNIDLIIDVPLQVTVVLGKSKKSIKDILDMGMGSVIVLDKLAGDMVDVLVNGKIFAHGEVVVINDNYGVRITELAGAGQAKQ